MLSANATVALDASARATLSSRNLGAVFPLLVYYRENDSELDALKLITSWTENSAYLTLLDLYNVLHGGKIEGITVADQLSVLRLPSFLSLCPLNSRGCSYVRLGAVIPMLQPTRDFPGSTSLALVPIPPARDGPKFSLSEGAQV